MIHKVSFSLRHKLELIRRQHVHPQQDAADREIEGFGARLDLAPAHALALEDESFETSEGPAQDLHGVGA